VPARLDHGKIPWPKRLVRNVKLNGKLTFVAPVITPKGSVSIELVLYKRHRLKVPAERGRHSSLFAIPSA